MTYDLAKNCERCGAGYYKDDYWCEFSKPDAPIKGLCEFCRPVNAGSPS